MQDGFNPARALTQAIMLMPGASCLSYSCGNIIDAQLHGISLTRSNRRLPWLKQHDMQVCTGNEVSKFRSAAM